MNYLRVLIITIITYLGISNYVLRNKVNKLDEELGDARNNIESYQSILSNEQNENRVLKLSIEDFKHSKDSLIQELSKTQDQLKIKNKKLKEAMSMSTVLTDTIVKTIPIDRNFNVELQSNPLTDPV
jgi:FtsZ-binding cell division protein ZapB